MADFIEKQENLTKETKTYEQYSFIDSERHINQVSSKVFKNEDKTIVYPFGYNGGPKYENISSITYIGFDGKWPVGTIKSVNYGWGFTKPLNAFTYYIDRELKIETIIIEKKGKIKLDLENKELRINEIFLRKINTILTTTIQNCKEEIRNTVLIELNKYFPDIVQRPEKEYKKDDLSKVLSTWGNDISEFSDSDKTEIINLFNKLSMTSFIDSDNLQRTKQVIDKKYIENTIYEFEKLITLTTDSDNLEKNWQKFLQEHNWIFGTIFAQPIILFQREAYVGGKTIDNSDGKFTDFLLKNNLSNNVSFFEIKTHLTKLLEEHSYRGSDVFASSKDLSGCISQVINQRDNFQKEFYSMRIKSKEPFEAFNCKCFVLIGTFNKLRDEQKKSFELIREAINDVTILTFDEVLEKLKIFSSLIG